MLTWEAGVGVLVTAVAVALEHRYDLFEWFLAESRSHDYYQLDELLILFVVGTVMLAIFAIRRSSALKGEAVRRKASEARFAALFAASPYPIGVFSVDDGTVLDANLTALRAAGMTREDIIGRSIRELPYWDAATADELLRRVRAKSLVRNMEVMTHGGTNESRPVLVSAQRVELDGQACFVAAMSDITDQRRAERARDAADAELAGVFLAMRDIVLVLGRDGEYLKVPTTNADRLYRPAAELVGKHVHDVLPGVEADAVCAVIRQSLDDRSAVMMEYTLRLGEREIWFSAVVTPLDGDCVVWVARDVTEERETRHALRESEAQYRLLFDRNPQPMFVVDEETFRYLDVNDAAIQHYGYSREEFLAMTATDLRPVDDVHTVYVHTFADWPAADTRVFRHRKRNGELIDVEITRDSLIYLGRPARLVLATDVTEQQRGLAQRRMLAERFESAFGDAPIGMTILSRDGVWVQVNTAMCVLLGRASDDLVGRSSDVITHPDDRKATESGLEMLRSGKERSIRLEKRFLHSSGRVVWTLVHATILVGVEDLIIIQVLDITEQRAAKEALLRQALVFETISEVVIVCEPDGRIVDVNPAAKAIFGYDRDELIGQTALRWIQGGASAAIFETIGLSLRTTGVWSGEYAFVAKDGRTGIAEARVTVLRDASGRPVSAIGVIRDVTERRQMQRHLLQAQKLEAIGSLAGGIAHEINTPMQYVGDNVRFLGDSIASLIGAVQAARVLADVARTQPIMADPVATFDVALFEVDMNYLMTELPLAAAHSREGCDRIGEIVKAMKGFSHPGRSEKQLVDLNDAVRDVIVVCRSEWKYVATLKTDFDAALPLVPCLPGELQQVVLNLIVNAAHAVAELRGDSGEFGTIAVSTRIDGAWAEIRVQDDGAGIPESIRARVFDPFFTTKKVGSGTGQGLSIAHTTIVRKHQGTLTFESTTGHGTTFLIRLPLDGGVTISEAA